VSFADYLVLERDFGHQYSYSFDPKFDLSGNGKLDFTDYLIFESLIPHPTPEPATIGLLALGGIALLRRRQTKHVA
jgi:hypothetical protein